MKRFMIGFLIGSLMGFYGGWQAHKAVTPKAIIGAVVKAADPLAQDIVLIRELHRMGKKPCINWY